MDRKINVLLVVSSISGGGAELVAVNLCRYLSRRHFEVHILHLKEIGIRGRALKEEGFSVLELPPPRVRLGKYLSFLQLRKIVENYSIDIIHSHNTDAFLEAALCKLSAPRVKWVHSFHYGNYPHLRRSYRLMERILWRLSTRLIAVGIEQRRILQHLYGITDTRITTIWNGVKKMPETISQKYRFLRSDNDQKVRIGSISTLIEQKGLLDLLAVAKWFRTNRAGQVQFFIVGDGPMRDEVSRSIQEQGLADTVEMLGWIENAAQEIFPHVDVFVQTSHWEAMSMVILEAMAAGVPIVATAVGDNRHVITDDECGFVIELGDWKDFIAKLDKLVASQSLRRKFSDNAYRRFRAVGTTDAMVKKHEQLYREL